MTKRKVYYLKHTTPSGMGYHRIVATSKANAVRKFNKGTRYTVKQVQQLKRVRKGENRQYIPSIKRWRRLR